MIPYNVYRYLSPEKQAQILWRDGINLELVRNTNKFHVELYSLSDFYVEIYFNRATEEPQYLRSFKKMRGLDPYLGEVNIDSVIKMKNDGSRM
jgi:hypothetical protein